MKDPHDASVIFSEHGRGILLIKGFMDEVKYNVDANKGTEVIMIKKLPEKTC
ncbi:MAG: ATP-binding protein [Candidatus Firestonebacteria bacterium]|nr:ATP-binding protein [Candidatus Firestonebacteria bacterium]